MPFLYIKTTNILLADVAELVDALDSKSSSRKRVRVRFPPSVRSPMLLNSMGLFQFKDPIMTYFVYALQSETRNYIYVGMTSNLERRINEHNNGYNKTTKAYRPFILIYKKEFVTRKEARIFEKYLKSGVGKEFLKGI